MFRYLSLLLLPAALLVIDPTPTEAAGKPQRQWSGRRARIAEDLAGTYVNRSNGGECYVEARGRGYDFTNENGTPAHFVFTGPDQLEMVAGDWEPGITATVQRDRYGRTMIRFDSPRSRPGYWVAAR
jgi:hypothetical protein